MNAVLLFLHEFYGLLLTLYPRAYRADYGDELQAVFNLSLDDAMKTGWLELASVVLRELTGLPRAILYEHLRERKKNKMTGKFASRLDFEPGSRNEFLAVLASFIIPMAVILFIRTLINYFGGVPAETLWLNILFAIFFFGSFLGMFAAGLSAGAPRWFLPYFGFILALINIYAYGGLIDPNWRGFDVPSLLGSIIMEGIFWSGFILFTVILILVSAWIPRFHPFYRRLRDDWTLLCFILYGTAPFALVLTFDDYQNEEPYLFLAFLILAAGGWLYLRNNIPWKRFLSLFGGLTLSMITSAVGKAILYAGPWPRPKFFTWQTEMMSTIIMWMWLAMIMLLPLAVNLLPRPRNKSLPAN
jgi:MFS family permease